MKLSKSGSLIEALIKDHPSSRSIKSTVLWYFTLMETEIHLKSISRISTSANASTVLDRASTYRKLKRQREVERSVAEVCRDRTRALARVSFGIGAAFICMHQAGKNKRIRACVSGLLFVIQFATRQSSSLRNERCSTDETRLSSLESQGRGSNGCARL